MRPRPGWCIWHSTYLRQSRFHSMSGLPLTGNSKTPLMLKMFLIFCCSLSSIQKKILNLTYMHWYLGAHAHMHTIRAAVARDTSPCTVTCPHHLFLIAQWFFLSCKGWRPRAPFTWSLLCGDWMTFSLWRDKDWRKRICLAGSAFPLSLHMKTTWRNTMWDSSNEARARLVCFQSHHGHPVPWEIFFQPLMFF